MKLELSVAQLDRHGNLNFGSGTRLWCNFLVRMMMIDWW